MMDLWAVHVKNTTGSPLCLRNHSIREKSFSFGKFSVLDVRVLKRRVSSFGYHSLSVKAMAKKNGNDNSNSSSPSPSGNGDGSKGSNSPDGNDFASQKSHRVNFDWREFRANLFAQEKAGKAESDAHNQTGTPQESKPLGLKWAHPIPVPETGCVLVATEKLDGLDQLREEIESDYWYVAACSSNLICGGSSGSSSESLWEEILQLMGGHYSELSRKPKRDV
ncbi:hypothetical protein D5086_019672 [Populus alba]|uniref:Uncharacterized protein n=1 Tax=Populus alba TaxID=43335 RepID=A0ACC4BHW9_POPAL